MTSARSKILSMREKKKKKKKSVNIIFRNGNGLVQTGFLYARTRPAGLNLLPDPPRLINGFFNPKPAPPDPAGSTGPVCHAQPQITAQTQTQTQISKTQVSDLWISLLKSQTHTQILTQIQTQIS